jgi:hypothetical protein
MANTHLRAALVGVQGALRKSFEASGANAAVTVSTPIVDRVLRLISVYVKYSAAPGVIATITYNAAHGATFDTLHSSIDLSSSGDEGVFIPDERLLIYPGDAYDVLAPAGGAGVTSQVTIICEEL